jgi:hypothetical protein
MAEENKGPSGGARTLAMVNVGIWAISIIALVFVIQRYPGAKGLFPILAGGIAVGVALISTLSKPR